MTKHAKIPGQFVTSVTASELLVSTGIQLIHWANDIAFTDAAFGAEWSVEAANRMACLSELLNLLYKRLPPSALRLVIEMPPNIVGQVVINPDFDPKAEEPRLLDQGSTEREGGDEASIDDFPF